MAAPIANESQYLAAINVDPSAPVINGTLVFVLISLPNSVCILTFGNIQSSAELDNPWGNPSAP
jgi:hypothetical protein